MASDTQDEGPRKRDGQVSCNGHPTGRGGCLPVRWPSPDEDRRVVDRLRQAGTRLGANPPETVPITMDRHRSIPDEPVSISDSGLVRANCIFSRGRDGTDFAQLSSCISYRSGGKSGRPWICFRSPWSPGASLWRSPAVFSGRMEPENALRPGWLEEKQCCDKH
jgi:hypothetical protein